MANVDFFVSTNMLSLYTWYGIVYTANSGYINVSDGYRQTDYFGSFIYDAAGNVYGRLDSIYNFQAGQMISAATQLNFDGLTAFSYINSNRLFSFFSAALNGPDIINGSNSADTLYGFAGADSIHAYLGNDYIDAGSGNDIIRGSGGNDIIDGGPGNDMAVLAGTLYQNTIRYDWSSRLYTISGPDGTDSLRSVERLRFSDGDRYIEDAAGLSGVVHRFYNTEKGVHFYTASNAEANSVRDTLPQYEHEGLSFRVSPSSAPGSTDVFRFFNKQIGYHFYTASKFERDQIINTLHQFDYEGVGYKAYSSDRGPQEELYRFFNTQTGAHFFTTSETERDQVLTTLPQFRYEGIAFYVDIL